MAEVMNSLFGITPESLMARRDQELQAQAMQYAKMDPFQRATSQIYMGANRLGGAVGGLLGAQDPEMMRLQQRQELAKQTQPQDATSWKNMAAQLWQSGDIKGATEAFAQAQALEAAALNVRKTESEITKNLREKAANDPFQKLVESGKYTPASLASYAQSGNPVDLVMYEKPEKEAKISFGPDAERISKALFGTSFDKLTPEQAARVNKEVLAQETTLKATGAPRQTVINSQETAFAKERGQLQAKTLAETEVQAKASANAVNRLTNMEKLNQGPLITGPLAGSAIGAGQFLSSLGLLSPDAAKTLGSSEIYDKQAKDLVMQDLGGKLGAQISNADREFIEARIPQLRNSQPARTELIAKLKEIHSKNIDYYQRMSKEATKKGNLNDFDFASGAPANTEPPKPTVATKRYNPTTRQLEAVGGK